MEMEMRGEESLEEEGLRNSGYAGYVSKVWMRAEGSIFSFVAAFSEIRKGEHVISKSWILSNNQDSFSLHKPYPISPPQITPLPSKSHTQYSSIPPSQRQSASSYSTPPLPSPTTPRPPPPRKNPSRCPTAYLPTLPPLCPHREIPLRCWFHRQRRWRERSKSRASVLRGGGAGRGRAWCRGCGYETVERGIGSGGWRSPVLRGRR